MRDYVSDDHIESIGEIATGQARIIQALSLDNSQKDKEIERLNNIIKEAIEYIEQKEILITYQELGLHPKNVKQELLKILGSDKE